MENDDILKRALIEAAENEFGDIPSDDEITQIHEFSDAFKSRIKKLQKRTTRKYIYIFNVPFRRMAVIAACIIIISTASLSIEAVRGPVIRYFVIVYEKFSSIFFVNDDNNELELPTALEILYSPTDIPDGYSLVEEINISHLRVLIYSNANGDEIEFQQHIISVDVIIDTEGIETEDIFINEHNGIFYSNKGLNNIVWHDNHYGYLVTGKIEKDLLQRFAESLKTEK